MSDNPNRTLIGKKTNQKKKRRSEQLLVPLTSSEFPSESAVVVGYEIYVFGGSFDGEGILDCRSNTWRDAPNMKKTFVYDPKPERWESYKGIVWLPKSECGMENV
ncbi:unnamed protein product [Cochlearia groenlandica]